MKMIDLDISCGDNNKTVRAYEAYGYEKTPVRFTSMQNLYNCEFLGSRGSA
jgi:hypothetical protein